MAINFEYYRIFYYVAKYRNLTQAASALLSNQPNVTRVIKNMEHELGCQLFIRSNKGVSLTAEGEQLYSHVAIAFEQLQTGEEELSGSISLKSGTVSIGASETALHLYLLDKLRLFHENYPNVRLKVYNYNTPQAITALRKGQVDFAVVATPAPVSAPFQSIHLKSFQNILAGGARYQEYSKAKHALKELSSHSLICLDKNTTTREFYERFYLEHGLALEPDIEVATADLVLPMILNNLGIGFLPLDFARRAIEEKQVFQIPLNESIPERSICMVYDTKRGFGVAARELQNMLREDSNI
ncbi:LysR family transcriptional regulator [Anaerolentibacter hominis]|uniref:LysR family transcriptional regulator n=1 Tax=Anaerolentibacter hominis TaxID=3079009 RepID=UPI0031B8126D